MSTRDLAEWITSISYEKLPSDVVEKAKFLIFDCLGSCVFTAARTKWGKSITDFALNYGGGQPEAAIVSTNRRSLAIQAALANGTLAEGFELGDYEPDTAVRPQAVTVPAMLAMASSRKVPGKQMIEAVVAGYETDFRIALAMNPSMRGRRFQMQGFHAMSNVGTFGGAASAGRAIGLTLDQMAMALGIAGSLTGGGFEGHGDGAWTRRLNAGMTASRGTMAALLAESGFVGPRRPLEGEYGFFKVFAKDEYDMARLTADLGEPYTILRTCIKPYPANGTQHAPLEALMKIKRAHNLDHSDIEAIDANYYQMMGFIANPDPKAVVSAQASLVYGLAVVSVRGKCTVDEYTDQTINDPAVRGMLKRVTVAHDPTLFDTGNRTALPGRVTVKTKRGEVFTEEVFFPKGNPRNPLTVADLKGKFASSTSGVIADSKVDEIFDRVMDLENLSDISEVLDRCVASPVADDRTWNT